MRHIFWVTALAVLSLSAAKNSTTKSKPKRQLETLRTPTDLQYSLVLPHSRVTHFRSLVSNRRISNGTPRSANLPPYAVQMEPVVQYSQKDPLYDPNHENVDDSVNKNEIYAQPKILNVHGDQSSEYTQQYGTLPTAPLYSHEPHPHYYEAPEPIIEIIIKESNESLPAPPPPPPQKKKKEPVQVFYVKYSKDPNAHDKVIYEKPVPAITPPTNDEDEHEHHEDYVTVTPEPYYAPAETTTLRAIIKPESGVYHSDSNVKVTFDNEAHPHHFSDRREGLAPNNEEREETAPRPAIAHPQQPPSPPPFERLTRPQYQELAPRPNHPPQAPQNYRPIHHQQPQQQFAQSRIQFQPPYLANEQQLPRQNPPQNAFRGPVARQNPFGPTSQPSPAPFPGPLASFQNGPPTFPGPVRPPFNASPPRAHEPQPQFHARPNNSPPFAPRPPFNGPPQRPAFHSGPQRPFHQPPQQQQYFDEAKYLQENYHTITTEQLEPTKEQPLPNRPAQPTFNFLPKPSPSGPPAQFQEPRPQHIPSTQLLPQQRPHQQFADNAQKASFNNPTPSRSPFYNLKPSPPHIEENRIPFHQPPQHQPLPQQQNNQFGFHQGLQQFSRPSVQLPPHNQHEQEVRFHASPSPAPQPQPFPDTQFLPQPSSPPQFNFHPQPSPSPERPSQVILNSPSERPFQNFHSPSERPVLNNFQDQSNLQHQQNVGQFVPNGGELVAAIPKYEQHITVSGPSAPSNYNLLGESSQPSFLSQTTQPQPAPTAQTQLDQQRQYQQKYQQQEQQYQQQQQQKYEQQQQQKYEQQQQQKYDQQQQQKYEQQQQQQKFEQQQQQKYEQQQKYQKQQQEEQQKQLQRQQQQQYDAEQAQVRQQLAQNVKKQQEEIHRLQSQLLIAQQQQQQQSNIYNFGQSQTEATPVQPQFGQERSRPVTYQPSYVSSTSSPPYYQSTSRTVEIKPTTQKYVSSTINSISTTEKPTKKEEKKKKPAFELPDEVPDDLRQQLLSSGILDNADISILDYDKVGDTPLESLPPDQLANFFSAGGGQQIAASEPRPIVVSPEGDRIQSRIDEEADDDQELAASENIAQYAMPEETTKQGVEMKVVHFNPDTAEGDKIAKEYVQDDATKLDTVSLNDKKYNRYLPLKVSGNQFPIPDVLKGKKVTSVVVLAPVDTEALGKPHSRAEREASNNLKGIKFIAGDSLQDLLKRPTKENFERWLNTEKKTSAELQSVVLLVTGDEDPTSDKEIYMYDITTGNVNKLDGDLSTAFVEAAENNSLSRDIEKLAIEGDGIPENFSKDDEEAEASENVPSFVELPEMDTDQQRSNGVSISSGYSKTKHGRSLRSH